MLDTHSFTETLTLAMQDMAARAEQVRVLADGTQEADTAAIMRAEQNALLYGLGWLERLSSAFEHENMPPVVTSGVTHPARGNGRAADMLTHFFFRGAAMRAEATANAEAARLRVEALELSINRGVMDGDDYQVVVARGEATIALREHLAEVRVLHDLINTVLGGEDTPPVGVVAVDF